MAGRPRTMARRVNRLWERFGAVLEELEQLMPEQYRVPDSEQLLLKHERRPCSDRLCQAWREAVDNLYAADDYFCDLWCFLDHKANQAKQCATADDADELDDSTDLDDENPPALDGVAESAAQIAAAATADADAEKLLS